MTLFAAFVVAVVLGCYLYCRIRAVERDKAWQAGKLGTARGEKGGMGVGGLLRASGSAAGGAGGPGGSVGSLFAKAARGVSVPRSKGRYARIASENDVASALDEVGVTVTVEEGAEDGEGEVAIEV